MVWSSDCTEEYEFRDRWNTYKYILLDDGYYDYYRNGKKTGGSIWTIANGEIHVNYDSGVIGIYRLNPDKSITEIASINLDGKRTDRLKEQQYTFIKVK